MVVVICRLFLRQVFSGNRMQRDIDFCQAIQQFWSYEAGKIVHQSVFLQRYPSGVPPGIPLAELSPAGVPSLFSVKCPLNNFIWSAYIIR